MLPTHQTKYILYLVFTFRLFFSVYTEGIILPYAIITIIIPNYPLYIVAVFIDANFGHDASDCGKIMDPCLSIGYGINQCNTSSLNGCLLSLYPGTYSSDQNTNLIFPPTVSLIGICKHTHG